VDIRHDFSEMHLVPTGETEPSEIESRFSALEGRARDRLHAEGIADEDVQLQRSLDMRYLGQWRSLEIPVDGEVESLDALTARFHDEHERQHAYKREETPVEIYQLKVTAIGTIPKPELPREEPEEYVPEPNEHRQVVFGDEGQVRADVYRRNDLRPGARMEGPAIIEQLDSTVVIPPEDEAEVDGFSNVIIRVGGQN
jgi:N-methylhydantoinase A